VDLSANMMITGLPGCGKTTLFKKLAAELRNMRPMGFYTEEIREGGVRKLIATTAQHGGGLIAEIKSREDVRIYTLTTQNRDRMLETILAEIQPPNTNR
jgi:nucleoside-triphosphatase THEP1